MKLLITGGCGFLGSNLAVDALRRGDELVIFDSLYRNGSRENLSWLQQQGKFHFEHGDIQESKRYYAHHSVIYAGCDFPSGRTSCDDNVNR